MAFRSSPWRTVGGDPGTDGRDSATPSNRPLERPGAESLARAANLPIARRKMERRRQEVMRNEFTALVERDGPYIAYCPETPGANGQGKTKAAARKSLASAIALILEHRRKDGLRGVPETARREKVVVC
jgi:predicted RNase H-like HicB family nuclease